MLTKQQQSLLHQIAYDSIKQGLTSKQALEVSLKELEPALTEHKASFVTLHRHAQLRGCIGALKPVRPLAADVVHNAYAAAFSDHRFPPVSKSEVDELDIHISILDTPSAMDFSSEADLIDQLQPGIDGLILESQGKRGTFLPAVWENIKDRQAFLTHLKLKAGLPADFWDDDIKIQRYSVEEF